MNKIATEQAELEFDRFIDLMGIDASTEAMDEEDKKSFELQKHRIIKSIETGALVINENGEPVYTPQRSKNIEAITFYEPEGSALMEMDRRKKNEDVAKMYMLLGSITKTHSSTFAKMKISDLKVCQAIGTLFLG